MTGQEPDIIIYQAKPHNMFSNPLEEYYKQHPPRPDFQFTKTSNWRGYVATWEIADSKLYLNEIEGLLKGGEKATIKKLFPNETPKVFAKWVSQKLDLPDGQILEYVHMGYNSVYERDIILTIKDGILTETTVLHNKAKKGHGFGKRKDSDPIKPEPPSNPPKPPTPPSI